MVQENYALMENLHDQCYLKCNSVKDVTFLTVKEGSCFRNCLNKFNGWYPTFQEHSRDAAFRTYWGLTMDLESELKKQ